MHQNKYSSRRRLLGLITAAAILLQGWPISAQTYTVAPAPFLWAVDASNNIIVGGCVWTYAAGTTTPATTYSNNSGTTNSNPIVADFEGKFRAYLIAGTSYKFIYETACTPPAHGSVLRTADNITGVPGSAATVDVPATAGETLSAGNCAYLSAGSGGKNAGQWYKCDAANTYSSTLPTVGVALAAITAASAGSVRIAGSVTGLSSLSGGSDYYVSGTAGAITSTAPANVRRVGQADSSTTIVWTANPVQPAVTGGVGIAVTYAATTITVKQTSAEVTLTDGATPALDASLGFVFRLTAAGNRTIAVPSNPTAGQRIIILHVASGADRTLALNSGAGGFRFGTDVTGLTITTSGKTDYIGCVYNAIDTKWDVVAYVKGY